jgi:membrane protein required for colicin V production
MIIDIVLLVFALTGFWLGYTKGVVRTLVMVAAYTVAVLVTLKISPWLMEFLSKTLPIGKVFALIFGTIAILVSLIFLIHWIAKKLDTSFQKGKLSGSDKIIGGVIMLIVGVLFYSMLLWPINQFNMIGEKSKASSMSYKTLETIPLKTRTFVEGFKPLFNHFWEVMEDTIQEAQTKSSE